MHIAFIGWGRTVKEKNIFFISAIRVVTEWQGHVLGYQEHKFYAGTREDKNDLCGAHRRAR